MSLIQYLLSAMVSWTQVPALDCDYRAYVAWERVYGESPEETLYRLNDVAQWLAYEAEVHRGPARTALELAAIGFEESKYVPYVDNGDCNRHPHGWATCDSGRAWTPWQFHPDTLNDVWRGVRLRGVDLLASRELQVRVAWDLILRRPMAWTTWSAARRRAAAWQATHPLPN